MTTMITLDIPGHVVAWLFDQEIATDHLRNDNLPPFEREWRVALSETPSTARGRGAQYSVKVSRNVAREMLSELEERADLERGLHVVDRNENLGTLDMFIKKGWYTINNS